MAVFVQPGINICINIYPGVLHHSFSSHCALLHYKNAKIQTAQKVQTQLWVSFTVCY